MVQLGSYFFTIPLFRGTQLGQTPWETTYQLPPPIPGPHVFFLTAVSGAGGKIHHLII